MGTELETSIVVLGTRMSHSDTYTLTPYPYPPPCIHAHTGGHSEKQVGRREAVGATPPPFSSPCVMGLGWQQGHWETHPNLSQDSHSGSRLGVQVLTL